MLGFEKLDKERAFCTLSIKEVLYLLDNCLDYRLESIEKSIEQINTRSCTDIDQIDINEVVHMTGYAHSTIHSKVSRNEIPVLSRNKPLSFSREKIKRWLSLDKPRLWDEKGNGLY